MEILRVSVRDNELNTVDLRAHHVIHGIASGTSDSDNFDTCERFDLRIYFGHGKYKITDYRSPRYGLLVNAYSIANKRVQENKENPHLAGKKAIYRTTSLLWQVDILELRKYR